MKTSSRATLKLDGFALVASLSLMILLTIVAVGLLGLSAVSLRGASQGQARAEAQANARLALMMAIGELQKQVGPDQRITANGAIRDDVNPTTGQTTNPAKNPHWTGVWDSWIAGPKTSAQLTTYPSQDSHHQTLGNQPDDSMRPAYAEKNKHFRSWLLSLNPAESTNPDTARTLALNGLRMPGPTDAAIELVGQGSLGSNAPATDNVSARLLKVSQSATGSSGRGRFAWWVGDESQKARILEDSFKSSPAATFAERIFRQQAPGSTGTSKVPGLENIANDTELGSLASFASLDLVTGAKNQPAKQNFHSITTNSHGILADVRDGGLKRDLSTLLERPISRSEAGDPFMLYRFDSAGQERVPIQDLAAFYQLYDSNRDPNKTKGLRYTSSPQNNLLGDGIQVAAPDYYAGNSTDSFRREYTSMYRSPVPVKIQMVVAARAEAFNANAPTPTYRLRLGIAPAVTLWNPNNVPLVMNLGDPARMAQQLRFSYLPFLITWNKNGNYNKPVSLAFAAMGGDNNTGKPGWETSKGVFTKPTILDMYFSGSSYPITFGPGQARIFSYPFKTGDFVFKKDMNDKYMPDQEAGYGWKSEFLQMPFSAWGQGDPNVNNNMLVLSPTDTLRFKITTEKENGLDYVKDAEAPGAGINFMMIQKIYQSRAGGPPSDRWFHRNYQLSSRTGTGSSTLDFNDRLVRRGFPQSTPVVEGDLDVSGMTSNPNKWFTFMQFALMAGCETSETTSGTFAGRKFPSRPFLHSSPISPPFIDKEDNGSLYNHGWNWWVEAINAPELAEVAVATDRISGFYGPGYSSFAGATHTIQQEIPAVPPMSLAALSHAHLGGFSLANDLPDLNNPKVTAVGQGGMFPFTVQAVGNSYAHPLIEADKAYKPTQRFFNASGQRSVTMADHSYLANKALWDDFFFSSITPVPSAAKIFETSTSRTAKDTARDFFFNEEPLPNRRMARYMNNMDSDKLDGLYASIEQNRFDGGLADKIAAHLLLEGPFNVNSTSVKAWKTLLFSLKGKPVAYLEDTDSDPATSGVKYSEAPSQGVPVGFGGLSYGKPMSGSSSNPSDPQQWRNWREITEDEIDELANAIVRQVKLRGPFLSLSEFVNRRLDGSRLDLSVKGALQAALDDPAVSINAGFKDATRRLNGSEISTNEGLAFSKALEGPVAYGSSAYVDQADILRHMSEQLTSRGDTFVIRSYGDSLDAGGKVLARAWCEAVVQRLPEYADPREEPHLKQADLNSTLNKSFGRNIQMISFRWLASSEI